MNLHPIFVHFPIALLTVYALMELVRFKKLMEKSFWFYAKALFLIFGTGGAFVALFSGDMAESAVRSGTFTVAISNFRQVVSMHENFADATVFIFGLLAVCYIILWINRENWLAGFFLKPSVQKFWALLNKLARFFVETKFVILLALAGLICVTITGGLGGTMVYGPAADPMFGFIYKLMFP
jgi:uncharacterized membrane protein